MAEKNKKQSMMKKKSVDASQHQSSATLSSCSPLIKASELKSKCIRLGAVIYFN